MLVLAPYTGQCWMYCWPTRCTCKELSMSNDNSQMYFARKVSQTWPSHPKKPWSDGMGRISPWLPWQGRHRKAHPGDTTLQVRLRYYRTVWSFLNVHFFAGEHFQGNQTHLGSLVLFHCMCWYTSLLMAAVPRIILPYHIQVWSSILKRIKLTAFNQAMHQIHSFSNYLIKKIVRSIPWLK